jgi:uncharacterized protein (TIGR00255 family)
MRSMTGFGVATITVPGGRIAAEARSVNHRFLEVRVVLPREYGRAEADVRNLVRDAADRGRVELTVSRTPVSDRRGFRVEVREEAARAYVRALRRLKADMKLAGEIDIGAVGAVPELVRVIEAPIDLQREIRSVHRVVRQALAALVRDREREGRHLARDMSGWSRALESVVTHIEGAAPRVVRDLRDRAADRIRRLAAGASVEPQRLAQEAAIAAERADVTEELVRLRSHLSVLKRLLRAAEPVGKRIEFVLQELQREVNTLGAKMGDPDVAGRVLDAKAAIEKLREQVQNVE